MNELCELAPRLAQHLVGAAPSWRDVVDAAGSWLRHELGVSVSLWNEACRMPRIDASSSKGSYFEPLLRYDQGFTGDPSKKSISNLQFAPSLIFKVELIDAKGGGEIVEIADVYQSNSVVHVIDSVLMPK